MKKAFTKDDERKMLSTLDLKLLEDNIAYFSQYKEAVEWKKDGLSESDVSPFAYPVYPKGMKLVELIEAIGGMDTEYSEHMKNIEQIGLLPTELNFAQIRSYITYIIRGEKFCDGHIERFMKNHVLLKLCLRLDDLVQAARHMRILIGRSIDCALRIEESGVSRQHALIYYNGNQWFIRDLNSTNGTMLNGKPIQVSMLMEGDKIQIWNCVITFSKYFLDVNYRGESRKIFLQNVSQMACQTTMFEEDQEDYDRSLNLEKDVTFINPPKNEITCSEKLRVGDVIKIKNYKHEIRVKYVDYQLPNGLKVDYAGAYLLFMTGEKLVLFNQKDIACIVERATER